MRIISESIPDLLDVTPEEYHLPNHEASVRAVLNLMKSQRYHVGTMENPFAFCARTVTAKYNPQETIDYYIKQEMESVLILRNVFIYNQDSSELIFYYREKTANDIFKEKTDGLF